MVQPPKIMQNGMVLLVSRVIDVKTNVSIPIVVTRLSSKRIDLPNGMIMGVKNVLTDLIIHSEQAAVIAQKIGGRQTYVRYVTTLNCGV